jgi:hypothetical protein
VFVIYQHSGFQVKIIVRCHFAATLKAPNALLTPVLMDAKSLHYDEVWQVQSRICEDSGLNRRNNLHGKAVSVAASRWWRMFLGHGLILAAGVCLRMPVERWRTPRHEAGVDGRSGITQPENISDARAGIHQRPPSAGCNDG